MGGFEWSSGAWHELDIGGDEATRRVRVTASQKYVWPFNGVENAVFNFVDDSIPGYTIGPDSSVQTVQITIPNNRWEVTNTLISWGGSNNRSGISLGSKLAAVQGQELFLFWFALPRVGGNQCGIRLERSASARDRPGPEFADSMEANGTITVVASDGSNLTLTGIGDSTEPYHWTPSNLSDARVFGQNLRLLTDRSLTVTFVAALGPTLQNGFTVGGVTYSTPGWHEVTGITDDLVIPIRMEGSGNDGRVDIFPQPNTV